MNSVRKLTLKDDLKVWEPLLAPLLRPCLGKIKDHSQFDEGDWFAWGMARKRSWFRLGVVPVAILVGRVIPWVTDSDESCQMLNVVSIAVSPDYETDAAGFARLLLDHAIAEAADSGLRGVTITTASTGKYHNLINELLSGRQGWRLREGKIVAHLSRRPQTFQLLQRLERISERASRAGAWSVAPYPRDIEVMASRIERSKANGWGIPWDPADSSYDWSPAWEFSRVVRSSDGIVGWLICHDVRPDLLRYAKLWMDPGWEASGAALALLAQIIRQAHFPDTDSSDGVGFSASRPGIHQACFISHPNNAKLNRLMVNKFKPVADSWVQVDQRYAYFTIAS